MKNTYARFSTIALIFFLASLLSTKMAAQSTDAVKDVTKDSKSTYTTWVKPISGSKKVRGYLLYLDDEVIGFRDFASKEEEDVPVVNIEYLQFRKDKGKFLPSLGGALVGYFAGGLIGYIAGGSDINAQPQALLGALVGLPVGASFGLSITNPKTTVHLYGNPAVYERIRGDLMKYTLKF